MQKLWLQFWKQRPGWREACDETFVLGGATTTARRQEMSCARVGVVGCGHLGKIHARLLAGRNDCKLVGVVDPILDVASAVAEPHVQTA